MRKGRSVRVRLSYRDLEIITTVLKITNPFFSVSKHELTSLLARLNYSDSRAKELDQKHAV